MAKFPILRHIRQFIATTRTLPVFNHWKAIQFGSGYNIYTHPLLETELVKVRDTSLYLIGFALDPYDPDLGNHYILHSLRDKLEKSKEDFIKYFSTLSGRFVLFTHHDDKVHVYNDPGGFRTVYYAFKDGHTYLGSQPAMLTEFKTFEFTEFARKFFDSKYFKKYSEYFLPSGMSFFEDVSHLVPNHYLDLSSFEQYRFYPSGQIPEMDADTAAREANRIMQNLITAAFRRYKLALPITAGLDSRYILAASRKYLHDIYLYTLIYKDLTMDSPEIIVPQSFLRSQGYSHNVLDCNIPCDDPAEIEKMYRINYDPVHKDWMDIAKGLYMIYPKKHLCIKGVASGIVKYYYRRLEKTPSLDNAYQLAGYEPGWQNHPEIVDHLEKWLDGAKKACSTSKIEVLDLMYWEHRIGGWQAQSQNEWDLVMDQFTPYVTRPWLELMFGVDEKHRREPQFSVFLKMIEML